MTSQTQDVLVQAANEIAVISTDPNGLITVFNTGAEQLLGYAAKDMIGQPAPILDFDTLKETFFSNGKQMCRALCRHHNGSTITVRLTTSPIKNSRDQITGYFFMAMEDSEKIHDLSELPDRRVFEIVLDREIRRMQREQQCLSLIRADMDSYKPYFAKYGELKTHQTLRQIAYTIKERIQRAGDLLAYHGQDEFMIVLPRTDHTGAVKVAEHIRLMIAGLEIEHQATQSNTQIVTISCGIASICPTADTQISDFMLLAQKGLDLAKKEGHNCTRIGE